jgi:NAD(P)-dependent dehydrogenase (short-subunit alcohol dehydrogenase family)
MSNQDNKTIFITGASSGLGKATAKLFASKGWKVIATMRNPEKEKELNKLPRVVLLPLDVTDAAQINRTVKKVVAMGGVDVVFNNAGYGLAGPLEGLTGEQIARLVNTNLLGVILTTKAFIPYFRKRRAGLFISTTSLGGFIAFPFNSIYHATKWGLEGWSESMAFELQRFGIRIKTVAPGGIRSDFFARSIDTARHEAYDKFADPVMRAFTDPKQMETYSSPEQIAEVVYEAATDGKDQLRYMAGADAKTAYEKRLKMGDEVFRKAMDKRFFGPTPEA